MSEVTSGGLLRGTPRSGEPRGWVQSPHRWLLLYWFMISVLLGALTFMGPGCQYHVRTPPPPTREEIQRIERDQAERDILGDENGFLPGEAQELEGCLPNGAASGCPVDGPCSNCCSNFSDAGLCAP